MATQWTNWIQTLKSTFIASSHAEVAKRTHLRFVNHATPQPALSYTYGMILVLKNAQTLCLLLTKTPQFHLVTSVSFHARTAVKMLLTVVNVTPVGLTMKKKDIATKR